MQDRAPEPLNPAGFHSPVRQAEKLDFLVNGIANEVSAAVGLCKYRVWPPFPV
jgi:hypothetical protein